MTTINSTNEERAKKNVTTKKPLNYWKWATILLLVLFAAIWVVGAYSEKESNKTFGQKNQNQIVSSDEVELPINWGDLGLKLTETGVINRSKLSILYSRRGGIPEKELELLNKTENRKIIMGENNSEFLLNLFWAFGLSNQNPILTESPMNDPRYGGVDKFASTGGWTLNDGNIKDHYSAHRFLKLTGKQQELVEQMAKNIYRPCCGNPTYFPDCNHGMAMLGLLELMAAQGTSEEDMYSVALKANALWFPGAYNAISRYFAERDTDWNKIEPRTILDSAYSSARGYARILNEVGPLQNSSGSSCNV